MLYKMKRNLNQKLINLIEYYNLIDANYLFSDKPLNRTVIKHNCCFYGNKIRKVK